MAEHVEEVFSDKDITSSATTVVKSGPGLLRSITVTKVGTTWQAKAYDNTAASGTVLINELDLNAEATYTFDFAFGTGLTIVTSGGTAGEIVVSYA
ncbi:MAG: hypothetical protein KGL39_22700 [Patescibacteria group bacterium]|nr:hypothetical protein [Patescibacteria group bacterium]